ncbi:ATP-dependent RNA helicase DHX58 [Gadus morhua]|uniref:ATP-dependent RNA helicase DHX58 n=1 Tax=Gadus morhua TaxID=8049 RepID=UPI0011B7DE11|nr:probable ATP-dependent RNA helicase DHX58 [Gadus morhua]
MEDLGLRSYQKEVVERAVKGENVIIWLPTGGGKTRAAVYVAKRHLETNPKAKVVVLVNKIHLVAQHYTKEFDPHLGKQYKLVQVSGDCEEKDFFSYVLKKSDLVICTAQILENALATPEDDRHVELSDITLLIIDECHHTHKEGVYNQIMRRYIGRKHNGERKLPQILGLTASPGGANTVPQAVDHVLEICANLDSAIVSAEVHAPELAAKVPRPRTTFDIVEKRPEDPFADHLTSMMLKIHEYLYTADPSLQFREIGTQDYEADVVLLEESGVKQGKRLLAQCALHLRQYNNALLINDTLRMEDAYKSLGDFYATKANTAIDKTDRFLIELFRKNQERLSSLSIDVRYANPKMAQLQTTLLNQFGESTSSRGIIFSKTRLSTNCLLDWVSNNPAMQKANIQAAILTGAGSGNNSMSQNQQKDTIRNFRNGTLNLLISTSVAEEGLDIQECNLVVRYGLLTNEIAQQQAMGRARANDSVYAVVAQRGSKEVVREFVNDNRVKSMTEAIAEIQKMTHMEFRKKITEIQKVSIMCLIRAAKNLQERKSVNSATVIKIICRNCFTPVAMGSDIQLLDNSHYVNVNPNFEIYYNTGGEFHLPKTFEDWEPGCIINCAKCNLQWGYQMKYKKSVLLANVKIKSFALDTPDGRTTVKQWKNVPFVVEDFNFLKYCNGLPGDPMD